MLWAIFLVQEYQSYSYNFNPQKVIEKISYIYSLSSDCVWPSFCDSISVLQCILRTRKIIFTK
jgi:hypothetical protein